MMKNFYDKVVKCSRCGNEAILTESSGLNDITTMCLSCGYYKCGSFVSSLELNDVNGFRSDLGMEPLEKLETYKNG
ncbi:MAG: hypothetical protein WCE54_14405 [Ignavibacteriaceae bacterium]